MPEGGELASLLRELVEALTRCVRERVVGIAEGDGSKRRRSSEEDVTRDDNESKERKESRALPEMAGFSCREVERVLEGVEDGQGGSERRGERAFCGIAHVEMAGRVGAAVGHCA